MTVKRRFLLPRPKEAPLAYRLLLWILLSSSLVTLLITALQLWYDYQHDVDLIEQRLVQIEHSYLQPLADSVWNLNSRQYETQMAGLLSLDDVTYAEILGQQDERILALGENQGRYQIQKTYPLLTHDFDTPVEAGRLIVVATLDRVYENLINKGLLILFSQGIKTLLISMIIVMAFYYLVTRHLWKIIDYTDTLDLNQPGNLKLDKAMHPVRDELDRMVLAINFMQTELHSGHQQMQLLNQQLEEKVAERTGELELAYKKLREEHNKLHQAQEKLIGNERRLKELTITDPLTGLGNRRGLDRELIKQSRLATRRGTVLALGMIDIDHFKAYNDTFGHQLGDEVLARVASIISKCLKRPTDGAYRYGGEEFVILLPEIDIQGVNHVGETIRKAVEAAAIKNPNAPSGGCLTVSIGGVLLPSVQPHDGGRMISLADESLYQAKRNGRNQVCWKGEG